MDKNSRDKAADGVSSDEDEAFESADEGEEGGKRSRPPIATSAGNDSTNSTSKELVGKNDTSVERLATIEGDISSKTAELNNEIPDMAENMPQETKGQKSEDIPSTVKRNSQDVDESNDSEQGNHGNAGNISKKSTEDEKTDAQVERKNEEKPCVHDHEEEINQRIGDEEKSSATGSEVKAKESTAVKESVERQNEQPSVVLDKDPCEENVEPYTTGKAEDIRSVSSTQKPVEETSYSTGGWGWGRWASVLSQATASVTSGLSSVIETVETSLGVPDPEEMARKVREEEEAVRQKEMEKRKEGETFGEGNSKSANKDAASGESFFSAFGVSSITGVMQSTGKELMSGGLDALEFIGKKTMDVLAEGDPGLREKREKLAGKAPTLSQILKEAKEDSEQKAAACEEGFERSTPTVDLFSEFDKFQGLAHLEALEMLSRDSEAKLESRIIDLTEEELAAVKPLLRAVEEVFHIDENDVEDDLVEGGEFKSEVQENVKSLNLPFSADKMLACQENARAWITTCVHEQDSSPGSKEGLEIYSTAVSNMAELTARSVELFHKFTELLLHDAEQAAQISSLVRAQCMRKMTDAVLEEISVLATRFAGCLNTAADDSDNPDSVNSLITTLYLDSSTSADYLRNSLKLLRPVLQLSSLYEKDVS